MGISSTSSNALSDLSVIKKLVDSLEGFLEVKGITRRNTPPAVWDDFTNLPPEQRLQTIQSLADYLKILEHAAVDGPSDKAERQLVWHVISYLNLIPPSGLFETLEEDDFVEIYDMSGVQLFRNLQFCKIVSYSVAEMSIYRWDQLYFRDEAINNLIISEGFQKGFSGIREMYALNIPQHNVREIFGERNRDFVLSFKNLSPLFGKTSRAVTHILATSQIAPASSTNTLGSAKKSA